MSAETSRFSGTQIALNEASLEELQQVPGIGPALAERIVAYRGEHGQFASLADLQAVRGIGPQSLARLAEYLTMPGASPEPAPAASGQEALADQLAPPGEAGTERLGFGVRMPAYDLSMELPDEEAAEPWPNDDAATAGLAGPDPGMERSAGLAVAPDEEPVAAATPASKEVRSAMSTETSQPQTAPSQEEPAAPQAPLPRSAEPPRQRAGCSSWLHDLVLIVAGGVAGVLGALLVVILLSGTLIFAPRSAVEDLRQTVNGLQDSQDGTSKRIADLADQASGLDARVSTLAALGVRVQDLEGRTNQLAQDNAALRDELNTRLQGVQQRLSKAEDSVAELTAGLNRVQGTVSQLNATLQSVENTLSTLQARVRRYDAFFVSLRQLLTEIEGPAPTSPAAESQPVPMATPLPSATALPTATPLPTSGAAATSAAATVTPVPGPVTPTPTPSRSG